jgi:5-methylthioribose kinase
MFDLTPQNIGSYLRKRGWIPPDKTVQANLLAWGVSNLVMRIVIKPDDKTARNLSEVVIKQSRRKLRTQAEWFSRLDRIWREADVITVIEPLLPKGTVPRVLFEDRENYTLAMDAIDANHVVWKESLLKGEVDPEIGTAAASFLGIIHRETSLLPDLESQFGDQTVFDELRIDPFYRSIALKHPDLKQPVAKLIQEMATEKTCLVLADFSPKNILVTATGVSLVDFETGHFGDPAFDLGFFLSHILLKAILHAPQDKRFTDLAKNFLDRYFEELQAVFDEGELARRTVGHLAGCLLARIDGVSPVDYLDENQQQIARSFAMQLFQDELRHPDEAINLLIDLLASQN